MRINLKGIIAIVPNKPLAAENETADRVMAILTDPGSTKALDGKSSLKSHIPFLYVGGKPEELRKDLPAAFSRLGEPIASGNFLKLRIRGYRLKLRFDPSPSRMQVRPQDVAPILAFGNFAPALDHIEPTALTLHGTSKNVAAQAIMDTGRLEAVPAGTYSIRRIEGDTEGLTVSSKTLDGDAVEELAWRVDDVESLEITLRPLVYKGPDAVPGPVLQWKLASPPDTLSITNECEAEPDAQGPAEDLDFRAHYTLVAHSQREDIEGLDTLPAPLVTPPPGENEFPGSPFCFMTRFAAQDFDEQA